MEFIHWFTENTDVTLIVSFVTAAAIVFLLLLFLNMVVSSVQDHIKNEVKWEIDCRERKIQRRNREIRQEIKDEKEKIL